MAVGLVAAGMIVGGCQGDVLPPYTAHELILDVPLTRATPVAVRHLAYAVNNPATRMQVSLTIDASLPAGGSRIDLSRMSVSVRPDNPAVLASTGSSGTGLGSDFDLSPTCRTGCHGGATVIVRGAPGAGDLVVRVRAKLTAEDPSYSATPPPSVVEIAEDQAPTWQAPTSAVVAASPPLSVTQAVDTARVDLTLHVGAQLLRDPLVMPLVGTITIRAAGQGGTHDLLWRPAGSGSVGWVTVKGETMLMAAENWTFEMDWGRFCTIGQDCEIPVRVSLEYSHLASEVLASLDNQSAAPIPDEFSFLVEIRATLEAFDGRSLPAHGLELTVG